MSDFMKNLTNSSITNHFNAIKLNSPYLNVLTSIRLRKFLLHVKNDNFSSLLNEKKTILESYDKCVLSKSDYVYFLKDKNLNEYFSQIFKSIYKGSNKLNVSLSLDRFDLWHGHFVKNDNFFAIIFHSKEYPAFDEIHFPFNLGWCQRNSTLNYNKELMKMRNFIWITKINGEILEKPSLWIIKSNGDDFYFGEEPLYTIYEDTFGTPIVDLYYLDKILSWSPYP